MPRPLAGARTGGVTLRVRGARAVTRPGRGPTARPRRDAAGPPTAVPRATLATRPSRTCPRRLALVEARVRAAVDRRRAATRTPTTGSAACTSRTTRWTGCSAGPARPARPGTSVDRAAVRGAAATRTAASAPRPSRRRRRRGARIRLRDLARAFELGPAGRRRCCWSRWRRTWTPASSACTAISTTTSRAAGRASGLALELRRRRRARDGAAARARLGPLAPLVAGGLLLVEDPDRPFLTRSLRVPDRVTAHLLGDDAAGPARRRRSSATSVGGRPRRRSTPLARALAPGLPLVYLRERPGSSGRSLGWTALGALGPPGDRPGPRPARRRATSLAAIAAAASREARLRGAGLVAGAGRGARRARRRRRAGLRGAAGARRCSSAAARWDPAWSREPPLVARCAGARRGPAPRPVGRLASTATRPAGFDPAVATIAFRLAPEQIDRAARAARAAARRRRARR